MPESILVDAADGLGGTLRDGTCTQWHLLTWPTHMTLAHKSTLLRKAKRRMMHSPTTWLVVGHHGYVDWFQVLASTITIN